ncbi:MAG: PKD domain-containing protein, partial [Thermoplasmatales archaeon]|nr:PKD domain-containing protein [Thermoplasmatales archaeon]
GLGLGCHCQPAVYDIDKDGHLELVTAYGSTCKVWDLVDWSLDFEAPSTHKCSEPPDFANVVGDEDLELIIPSGWAGQTLVYDSSYQLIYQFNEYGICTMTQDVDNDGLNEILYLRNGILICYDTAANAPTPSVRTDTPYYSERRTAAGEYIPPIGGSIVENSAPIFSAVAPSNGVTNLPIGTSSLSVTIEDPDGDLFDWTIETSPDIGSSQANGASNGSKSCSVSGLSYSTTYHWFVNATDGEVWTRRLYSFTTETNPANSPPVVSNIPGQTISEGESFNTINLDNYVDDVEDPDSAISWSYSGNSQLTVSITNRVATISTPNPNWNGQETITFTAEDTGGLTDSDAATFTVNPTNGTGLNVDAGGPYVGFEDEPIQFFGSATGGEEPYSWSWDFGDGVGTSTQQDSIYIYDNPGDYAISLTVTDSTGDSDTEYTNVYVASNGTLIVDVQVKNANIGSANWVRDGDTVEIIAVIAGYGASDITAGDITADLSELGLGKGAIFATSYINFEATWTTNNVICSPENGKITVTVNVNDLATGNGTITADNTAPEFAIHKPENGLYFFNRRLRPLKARTIIIGAITIELDADDNLGIDRTEFYLDNELMETDTGSSSPEWYMHIKLRGQHNLKIIVYDHAGNTVAESKMITVHNLFGKQ